MKNALRILLSCLALSAGCGGGSAANESSSATTAHDLNAAPEVTSVDATVGGDLLPPLPLATTSFGAAVHDDAIYVLGGYAGEPHAYNGEDQSPWLFRLQEGAAWEQVARLPHGLQGHAMVAAAEGVCRIGGNRIDNRRGEPATMRSLAEVSCYHPGAREWTALPSLPEGRSSFDATVIGRTIYVAGGWRLDGAAESATWARTLAALDLDADRPAWRAVEQPFERRGLAVAAQGERVVVIGGLTPDRSVSSRVDLYSPATDTWSEGPEFPGDAFGVAATTIDGAVVASGRDGTVYRLGDGGWEAVGSLAFGRFFHQLVPHRGALVALGGISGMHTRGRTRHVERLSLEAGSVSSLELAYPGAAKNRQALFLLGDDLYFFGGNRSLGQHDFEPEDFLSEGWRLHLPSLTWERVTDFPARRQTMQTVVVNDQAFAAGGFGHNGAAAVSQDEIFRFDAEEGTWEPAGRFPRSRTQFGFVASGDALWAFGGLNYDPARGGADAFDHVTTTLRAPIDGDGALSFVASEEAALSAPRRAFASAALDGTFYIVGGMREGFDLVDGCLAIDLETHEAEELPCPGAPRLSGDLVAHEEQLYLVSGTVRGEDGMESSQTVEVLDLTDDEPSWEVLVPLLPFDTRHARALTYGGRILVVSTHNDEGRLRLAFVTPR